ncbi:hypothetical protein GGF31_004014 [Allomyces arbusculus]|nr:hypothetical protein GGF31_004014 [Allomyces arbusculus]
MPTDPHPSTVQVCEPVVLASRDRDQGRPARSLVQELMDARTTHPLLVSTSLIVKSLISMTSRVTEMVRVSGGVPMSVPAATKWHLHLSSIDIVRAVNINGPQQVPHVGTVTVVVAPSGVLAETRPLSVALTVAIDTPESQQGAVPIAPEKSQSEQQPHSAARERKDPRP